MKERCETNRIIIHHSLSSDVPASTIKSWHIHRGFMDIGYHYVIRSSGAVENGRAVQFVGAHAVGRNWDSIGICLCGNFKIDLPLPAQYETLFSLYHSLCRLYCKNLAVEFHRAVFNPCPGKKFDREYTRKCCAMRKPF